MILVHKKDTLQHMKLHIAEDTPQHILLGMVDDIVVVIDAMVSKKRLENIMIWWKVKKRI